MADDDKIEARKKLNREQLAQIEKPARGNIHSEPDEHAPDFDAPPALSH